MDMWIGLTLVAVLLLLSLMVGIVLSDVKKLLARIAPEGDQAPPPPPSAVHTANARPLSFSA